MILLCGIPSETPLAMVRAQLDNMDMPYVLFNQRRFAAMTIAFELSAGQVTGRLQVEGQSYRLEEFGGVYTRLMDDQRLPELCDAPADAPPRRACRALHDTLIHWCELAPGARAESHCRHGVERLQALPNAAHPCARLCHPGNAAYQRS
jgi:hypothetical protein